MTVVSQDSDFFQLITENVRILRYRGDKSVLCGPEYIREKLGIEPEQYADFKSLTGDTADNIRGVEKIGPKTAAQLLGQFGTLDAILTGTEQVHKPSIRATLEKNGERVRLNRLLIRLEGTKELPFTLEQMAWEYRGQTSTEVLKAIGVR